MITRISLHPYPIPETMEVSGGDLNSVTLNLIQDEDSWENERAKEKVLYLCSRCFM
jgi:hypothetical protein